MNKTVPDWIIQATHRIVQVLMLTERIKYRMVPKSPVEDFQAEQVQKYTLSTITIDLPYDTENDRQGHETLLHEALHAMQPDFYLALEHVMDHVPADLRKGDTELLNKVNERFVERVSWAMCYLMFPDFYRPAVPPKNGKKEPETPMPQQPLFGLVPEDTIT